MKRAISLAGGGPAAGLEIGALKCLHDHGLEFDVWALACIGVWVGGVYNTFDKHEAPERTLAYFKENIFREDAAYAKFPIGPGFKPDIQGINRAAWNYLFDPASYRDLVAPEAVARAARLWRTFLSDPRTWNPNGFSQLALETAAANPVSRFLVSWAWKSGINGLTGGSDGAGPGLTRGADFERLYDAHRPFIYHNAWDLKHDRIQLFANRRENRPPHMKAMTVDTMRACSALPYIIETVAIDGVSYCEGALDRIVNFDDLLQDHPDLEEVWIVRIIDPKQIRPPKNLDDAFNNLCMLFAGSLGQYDVEDFERKYGNRIAIRDIRVSHDIDYDWTWGNLEKGVEQGYANTLRELERHGFDTSEHRRAKPSSRIRAGEPHHGQR